MSVLPSAGDLACWESQRTEERENTEKRAIPTCELSDLRVNEKINFKSRRNCWRDPKMGRGMLCGVKRRAWGSARARWCRRSWSSCCCRAPPGSGRAGSWAGSGPTPERRTSPGSAGEMTGLVTGSPGSFPASPQLPGPSYRFLLVSSHCRRGRHPSSVSFFPVI